MEELANQKILIPELGGADAVEVIEISVAVGDQIDKDQSIIVVESDKASMDIPSPEEGEVVSISVAEGDEVKEGDVILELSASSESKEVLPSNKSEISDNKDDPVDYEIASAPPETNSEIVLVPDLGGADKVELIEILVNVGERVNEGDGIILMESDKASMELPSPFTGTILSLKVKEGDLLAEGDTVAELEVLTSRDEKQVETKKEVVEPTSLKDSSPLNKDNVKKEISSELQPKEKNTDQEISHDVHAGPAVRKLARELGVELSNVSASGSRGRIDKQDLYDYVKNQVNNESNNSSSSGIPSVPVIDFSEFGEISIEPMTKLHNITAANMHRSWLNVPHVTQFDEADISDLEIFRSSLKSEMEKRKIKITPLAFIMKAVSAALIENPMFNSSISEDGKSIIFKKYVNIGMAVDTPAGLMVPVIRDVDKKGLWQLSKEIIELAGKAKERKLKPAEMQGGCFTISSLGGIGGTGFTPIVNTPEVGILGVSKLSVKPVFIDGEFVPRKILPLSLSYDHRAVNGGDAGRFISFIVDILQDTRRLSL